MGGRQRVRWEEDIECDGRKTESAMGGRHRVRWEEDRECDGRKT